MVRIIFYLALIIFTIVSVNLKINVIKEKRTAEVISINNEYIKHGKPVEVYEISQKSLHFYERVSGRYINNEVVSFISQLQWGKIKVGQKVVGVNEKVYGIVNEIGTKRDALTGLYLVKIKLEQELIKNRNDNVVLDINIKTINDALQIPSSAVKTQTDVNYVWTVDKNSKAKRKEITLGLNSGKYVQVRSGLGKNEKIILRGSSFVKENDQLRIINLDGVKL